MGPQRIIKPAYEYVKSPITMRAVAMFLALVFLAYILISDYNQRQEIAKRYEQIAQNTENSRVALAAAKELTNNFERSLKNSAATLVFMQEMAKSMQEVTDILQSQRKEHALMINGGGKAVVRKNRTTVKKKTLRKCFDFIPRKKRIGNNEIVIYEGIDIPCE